MEKIQKIVNLSIAIIKSGNSPLFLGDRGIGKTNVAFQIAEKLNLDVVYLNISQTSPENLNFPYIENGILDFKTIDFNNKLVILDEITNRNPDMHSFLQSFVLEKRIGNTRFQNLHFIATGNKIENSNLVVDLSRPLIERFVILDFPIPSKEEWAMYTYNKNGDEKFINFILQSDDSLYYVEENEGESNLQNIPSPRNNTRTAILLKELENNNMYSSEYIFDIVKGSSGKVVAQSFVQYLESGRYYNYELFTKGDYPRNNNEVIALCSSTVNNLKSGKITLHEVDKVLGYIIENYPRYKDYFIAYVKLSYPDNKGVAILYDFGSKNPNSNIFKVAQDRIRAMKSVK